MILPDTTLCAIVRDEAMNPAGGIIDFVDSTVPFVEQAVIVDTGSVDGTREMLEQLGSEYRNLTVVDATFTDYASARNISLKYAKTKRVLVLDADERLTREDFKNLKKIMKEQPAIGYNFEIINIYGDEETETGGIHNPRLFTRKPKGYLGKVYYENTDWRLGENLYVSCPYGRKSSQGKMDEEEGVTNIAISIKHFHASVLGRDAKDKNWYTEVIWSIPEYGSEMPAPSRQPHFASWKQYNPRRELYR